MLWAILLLIVIGAAAKALGVTLPASMDPKLDEPIEPDDEQA